MYASRLHLEDRVAHYGGSVQAELRRILDTHAKPSDFYGMMRYHLGWADQELQPVPGRPGKGLRGQLLLLGNNLFGGEDGPAVPLAAAVELLHNFSLIHDDIEDGGALRRHRPTVWALWGSPLGINVGDGMHALAYLALFESSLQQSAPERFIGIMRTFEQAALRLCEGQHLDMSFETAANVTVAEYLDMIAGKTAALISASAAIGALAAGAGSDDVDAMSRVGAELGLAFQMQDDILGIWGDEAMTGKSARSDIASRKKTLPVLLALAHASADARAQLRELYAGERAGADGGTNAILALLDGANARRRTEERLAQHWHRAEQALTDTHLAPVQRDAFLAFARALIDRVA